jgi:dipeptidyl aminopeptidase/acylaminoacyl peptidase
MRLTTTADEILPTKNSRVIKNESDQIVEQLQKFGKNVKYIVFENEGHGFTKTKNKKHIKKQLNF